MLRSTLVRSPLCILLLLGLLAGPKSEAKSHSPELDLRPALRLGDYEVSAYLVDKYYHRYLEEIARTRGRTPTPADKQAALERLLSEQVVIADLATRGFQRRPEVQDLVYRMSRHMLTKTHGLYFNRLYEMTYGERNDLESIYLLARLKRPLFIAHFPNPDDWRNYFGEYFDGLPDIEKRRRIEQARNEGKAEVFAGSGSWPYPPFLEIADELALAPIKRWVVRDDAVLGTYCYFMEEDIPAAATFPAMPDHFPDYVHRTRQQIVDRAHRKTLLHNARVAFSVDAIAGTAARLKELKNATLISPTFFSKVQASVVLCTYEQNGRQVLTTTDFVNYWNGLFVRTLPTTPEALCAAINDLVVEDAIFRAASVAGLDQDPQFLEDRRGFEGYQMLGAFEREELPLSTYTNAESQNRARAQQIAKDMRVEDRIDYARYGLNAEEIAMPWREARPSSTQKVIGTGGAKASDEALPRR